MNQRLQWREEGDYITFWSFSYGALHRTATMAPTPRQIPSRYQRRASAIPHLLRSHALQHGNATVRLLGTLHGARAGIRP